MKIKRQIISEETMEVPAPSWWKDRFGMYYSINEQGIIVRVGYSFIDAIKTDSSLYSRIIDEAIGGESIDKPEFETQYSLAISKLNGLTS